MNKILLLVFAMILLAGSVSASTPITDCTSIDSAGIYELQNDIQANSSSAIYVTQGSINSCILINSNNVILEGNGYTVNATDTGYVLLGYMDTTNTSVKNLNLLNTFANDYIDNQGESILPFIFLNVSISDGVAKNWINTNLSANPDIHLFYFVFADMVGSSFDLINYSSDGTMAFQLGTLPMDANYTFNDNTVSFLGHTCINVTKVYGDVWFAPYFNAWNFTNLSLYKDGVWIYSSNLGIYGANLVNGAGYYCVQDYVPVIEPTSQSDGLIQGQGNIYSMMKSSGAGLGKFLGYMTSALFTFLVALFIVGTFMYIVYIIIPSIKLFLNIK